MAQFQSKVDDLNAQADAAAAKGNATKEQDLRAQAAQWQEFADAAAAAVNDK